MLAREQKAREKKPGRGGKGTIGKDTFEEISARLGEVEDGLRGGATSPLGSPPRKLDSARQRDLALLLSIRLTLSYFTLRELAEQLLVLSVPDAERALLQHIRRRVAGEGRWGVGKELEFVEGLVRSSSCKRLLAELNADLCATSSSPGVPLGQNPYGPRSASQLPHHLAGTDQISRDQADQRLRPRCRGRPTFCSCHTFIPLWAILPPRANHAYEQQPQNTPDAVTASNNP